MEKEDLLRTIVERLVKGKSHSAIANELGLTRDEVNQAITEIRESATKAITEDEIKFYLMDTLLLFSELEKTAWNEFEISDNQNIKVNLIKAISKLRKDALDIRREFEVFVPKKKKEIPYQKVEELAETVRVEISKRAMRHLEPMEALPEPEPFVLNQETGTNHSTVVHLEHGDQESDQDEP